MKYHSEHRAPQGYVLSPLLFTLLSHECSTKYSLDVFIKLVDNTTVVGLIRDGDKTNYRSEESSLTK